MTASSTAIFQCGALADFAGGLRQRLAPESIIRENEPLSKRTTLRVGGPADMYVEPASETDLATILKECAQHDIAWMVLGRGSNLLVRDGGIRGVVISLAHSNFAQITASGETLRCGAGARLRSVAFEARKLSLTGLEFLEGIPGNIGGGLRMNAGAMGSALFDVVESVRFMDANGEAHEESGHKLAPEYRSCPLLKTNIALAATLKGKPGKREEIEQRMNACSQKRWGSQPAAPSAGCIFKNSITVPSGRLIEELGLKGTRRGGAVISDVHGNFIVNDGNASARDVLELIDLIKERAHAERGIDLHTEVQIVGEE
jgi:UDP-N-acetylenolpyruvoylglucosamine reductase